MLDNICALENKVFYIKDSSITSYVYDKHDTKFNSCKRFRLPLPNDFKLIYILLDNVQHFLLGINCLIILAIGVSKDVYVFMHNDTLKNNFLLIEHFKWYKDVPITENVNLLCTHGPTLLTVHENALNIHTLSHKLISDFDLKNILRYKGSLIEVLQSSCIGQIVFSQNTVNTIFLVIKQQISEQETEINIILLSVPLKKHISTLFHKLCSTNFFPISLNNILTFAYVDNINFSNQEVSKFEDLNFERNRSFICNNKEFLIFYQGILKYIFLLPSPDIKFILTEFSDIYSKNIKLLLTFKSDNICLFNKKKERNEFQLTKSWNNVKSILTGDFLLTGYSQLLLIKTQKFNCWQENCILSDITNFIPVDLIYQSKKSDESMNKTIPGIMANIETGKAAIEKTQSDIIQKSEAIHHALYQCNCGKDDVNINHHVSSFTETLVDILLNDHENSKQENISNNVQLELLNHWIRVCNNCWILCWTLTNTSEKTICNPFINIISKDQQLQSIQKVFVHKNTEFAIDDQIQKHVERKKTFSIILHLENPKFLIESTKVLVNLTWYSGNSDEFENELFSPFEEKVLFQKKLSLNTTLAFSTMFVRKDSPDTYKNLACMKVQQQEMILNVTSLHSSFAQFEAYFTTSTFDEALLLSPHHSELKILIFRNINSPLHGVSMNFKNEEENEVEVVAYVRNDHQMYSLVQYMYHSLPQDVLILPKSITHTESVEMKRQAVINMKTEVDMLASAMKIHNIQDFATANPQLPTQAGSVNIPKETYLRIRRSLMKSECLTDNIMQSLSKNEEKVKL